MATEHRAFWLVLFVLAGLLLISLTRYMHQYRRMEEVYRFAATQNAVLKATRQALADALTATPDLAALEQRWRERTGQVKPGELPVRVQPPEEGLALSQMGPAFHPTPEPPWRAWLRLFFGP